MNIFAWLKRQLFPEPPTPAPRPASWHKTLDELSAENRSLGAEEIQWAREYEVEQLRRWVRFPRDGEVFEALDALPLEFLIHWRAPYTTDGKGVLPKGTRVRVFVHPAEPEPVGVQAIPVDEKRIEQLLVPELDRNASKYAGYSLYLSVARLNREFKPVTLDES